MPEQSPAPKAGAQTFKEAYGVLQQHAQSLRDQDEPNIDDLLTIVTESVAAYKVCKQRIDAVESALKAALDDVGLGPAAPMEGAESGAAKAAPAGRPVRGSAPAPRPEGDDDVPF